MSTDLLPLSLADVFDEAFDLYKTHFALLAGIVAIVHVPVQLAVQAVSFALGTDQLFARIASSGKPDEMVPAVFGMLGYGMLLGLFYLAVFVVQSGALTVAVSETYLDRTITLAGTYAQLRPHLARLMGSWSLVCGVLFGVITAVFWIVAVVAGVFVSLVGETTTSEAASIAIAVVVLVPCALATVAVFVRTGLFITPIVIIEGIGGGAALQRNTQLVRGRFWRLLGAVLLLAFVLAVLTCALVISLQSVVETAIYPFIDLPSTVHSIVTQVLIALTWLLLQPFWMVCLTLFYYDQRVRREGFDLSLLERQVEGGVKGRV